MRRLIATAVLSIIASVPAHAAERRWPIGSVSRLRVEAPVEVRVVTGGGNGVVATASAAAAFDGLEVIDSGGTLVIRASGRNTVARPIVVTVSTPRLDAIAVYVAAAVNVSAMRGDRVTVSNAGSGALRIERVDAEQLAASLVGDGTLSLSGRAGTTRLVANGPGSVDAQQLTTDRLTVQASGDAVVRAAARYEAAVNATGAAQVDVAGRPQCDVRAQKGTLVRCAGR